MNIYMVITSYPTINNLSMDIHFKDWFQEKLQFVAASDAEALAFVDVLHQEHAEDMCTALDKIGWSAEEIHTALSHAPRYTDCLYRVWDSGWFKVEP